MTQRPPDIPVMPQERPAPTEAARLAMSPLYGTGQRPAAPRLSDLNGQIHERNGVWVVTVDGIWRGDYLQREHAIAAITDAGHAAWLKPR